MAQTVFRPTQLKVTSEEVLLPLIHNYAPEEEVPEEVVEEYTGPTADDLRREAEAFKSEWDAEKQRMIDEAKAEADEIIKKAEDTAFAEVKRQSDQAQIIKTDAERNASEIIKKAQAEAQQILSDAQAQRDNIKESARSEGYAAGHEEGYKNGKGEVERLTGRIHKVIEAVMQRREEILKDTEQQIVELVVLMTRKVVKIISDTQKTVIMNNVIAALKKVKSRGHVILHVNTEDLKLTTEHIDDFIKKVELVQGISIIEDSTVEKGGCVVETDFGAVDARISSQLTELENKIMEISPVKSIERTSLK